MPLTAPVEALLAAGERGEVILDLDALPEVLEMVSPAGRAAVRQRFDTQLAATGAASFETEVRRKDATLGAIEVSAATYHHGGGAARLLVVRDVTERRRNEAELSRLALHDALTDLPNRSLLTDRLHQAILAAERAGEALTLLVLDLDRFKQVNDAHGHAAGDALLREVGRRLRAAIRAADTVARLGGDEFGVVLPGAARDGALRAAHAVHAAVERAVRYDDQDIEVPSSVGVATFPEHGRDAATLLRRADIAMYEAKRAGGGFLMFAPEQEASGVRRRTLVSELRHAIDREELVLHYQPMVDLRSGRTVGVEALARWAHPARGTLPPALFVPAAEQSGLIRPLTRLVVATALRQCRTWRARRHDLRVSVNISMRNLLDPELPHTIVTLLAETSAEPDWLCLEITETAVMADRRRAQLTMTALHGIGVRVALDDFGTGYSSLAYLHSLTADQVKIDRSFVSGLGTDRAGAAIVRAAVDVGHDLGFEVAAEGVEDQAAWQFLSTVGCDTAQGYYLARPMPAGDVERWLSAYEPRRGVPA